MTNPPYPPLPDYMTLEEAAEAVSIRLGGQQWSARQLLGCADRGEVRIAIVVPTAARFVPINPQKGVYDEFTYQARWLIFNFDDSIARQILLYGTGYLTERPAPRKTTPFEKWATDEEWVPEVAWKIADGETPPEIRLEDCRVTADSLEGLIARYAPHQPATDEQAPPGGAPVVATSKSEPRKADEPTKPAWPQLAKDAADRIYKRNKALGGDPSIPDIAKEIEKEFADKVFTVKDKRLNADYIKRHGLEGWKRPKI